MKNIFNFSNTDTIQAIDNLKKAIDDIKEQKPEVKSPKEDEWVWVEGYKGTDANMRCNDYQYEFDKQHNMPDDAEIVECSSGFHLCLRLKDVFNYYSVGDGNRFFKVRALVRQKDAAEYGRGSGFAIFTRNKLVSKSIIFLSELSADEILQGTEAEDWTPEDKQLALNVGIAAVIDMNRVSELMNLGYSKEFSQYIIKHEKDDLARALGTQEGLSMDMKALLIVDGNNKKTDMYAPYIAALKPNIKIIN